MGVVHAHDNMFEDYEEKLAALQTLREKDMEKIASLGEIIEQVYKSNLRLREKGLREQFKKKDFEMKLI